VVASRRGNRVTSYAPFATLVVIADLYALVRIYRSDAPSARKWFWNVAVLLLPVVGVVLWLFFGPS
jgi:hypothetical protein